MLEVVVVGQGGGRKQTRTMRSFFDSKDYSGRLNLWERRVCVLGSWDGEGGTSCR